MALARDVIQKLSTAEALEIKGLEIQIPKKQVFFQNSLYAAVPSSLDKKIQTFLRSIQGTAPKSLSSAINSILSSKSGYSDSLYMTLKDGKSFYKFCYYLRDGVGRIGSAAYGDEVIPHDPEKFFRLLGMATIRIK